MTGTRALPLTPSDVHDVAQLAGGLSRVVDTAVVALLERGRLRVDDTGRLRAEGSTPGRPVESAVLDLVGTRFRRTVASVRLRAPEDPRLTEVADRLVAAGLLRRNPFAVLAGHGAAHLRTAAGRRALAEVQATPAAATGLLQVALEGPQRMADRALYDSVFGVLPWAPASGGRPGRCSPAALEANGNRAWAYGSSGLAGWGGHGGGGGGGDGGGCGGGDGGGGGSC